MTPAQVKVKNYSDETRCPYIEYPIKGRESLIWLRETDADTP